jgi:hypothetical protein
MSVEPAVCAGMGRNKRGFPQRSDELIQHDGGDQAGGTDQAEQLQESEGFTRCGRDLLRGHGQVLKVEKTKWYTDVKAVHPE